jgi:hypothetical protein
VSRSAQYHLPGPAFGGDGGQVKALESLRNHCCAARKPARSSRKLHTSSNVQHLGLASAEGCSGAPQLHPARVR